MKGRPATANQVRDEERAKTKAFANREHNRKY